VQKAFVVELYVIRISLFDCEDAINLREFCVKCPNFHLIVVFNRVELNELYFWSYSKAKEYVRKNEGNLLMIYLLEKMIKMNLKSKLLLLKLLLFCLAIQSTTTAQQLNRPVPADLFGYEYVDNGFSGNDYLLGCLFKINSSVNTSNYKSPYPVIFDAHGYVAWYAKPNVISCGDFKYWPTSNLYTYSAVTPTDQYFQVLDDQFNYQTTLNVINGTEDFHDIQRAENGNWLLATQRLDTVDLSMYTFAGTQGSVNTVIIGFGVQELDAANNVVFEWNSNDYISPTETYDFWGYSASSFDYCHGNAIEEDVDGNLLLSFRHLNAVYKIDRFSGNIIWRLGGESSSFTFPNDSGFSGQHDIRRLGNGNYTVFDNSNMSPMPHHSRGVEYALDTMNWTATKVSEYINALDNFSRAMGSYRTLEYDEKAMGYGLIYRPNASAAIIDGNQQEVGTYFFEDSVMTYRMNEALLPNLPRPIIECNWNGAIWELQAPPGLSSYLWSTGETTSSINLTQLDIFQVWTPLGIGFVGSLPFPVTDLNDPCGQLGIPDFSIIPTDDTFTYYDLLGRMIAHPEEGQLYIQVWESGEIQKIMYFEE